MQQELQCGACATDGSGPWVEVPGEVGRRLPQHVQLGGCTWAEDGEAQPGPPCGLRLCTDVTPEAQCSGGGHRCEAIHCDRTATKVRAVRRRLTVSLAPVCSFLW